MTKIIKKTGLTALKEGESAVLRDILNPLIENSDQTSEELEGVMKGFFNLNTYLSDYSTRFTLPGAIKATPLNRIWPGIVFRFLSETGKYVSYIFQGGEVEDLNNWIPQEANIIDGGVW